MSPNMHDIFMFLTVVETRSFTGAADRLSKTKSAVSQAVTRLEQDLGFRLLFRSTRSLSLTEAGAKVYSQGKKLKETYDEVVTAMARHAEEPSGTLVITAPHALSSTLVAPVIAKFLAIHPKMQFRLMADDAHTDLVQSQVDLAIRVGSTQVQSAKISKMGLLHESLYASPAYLKTKGLHPRELEDTLNWHHLANEWQGNPIRYKDTQGKVLSITPHIRCDAFPDILRLAELGVGAARLPDIATQAALREGRLVRLFPLESTPVYYLHLFPNRTPAGLRQFIDLLKQEMALVS